MTRFSVFARLMQAALVPLLLASLLSGCGNEDALPTTSTTAAPHETAEALDSNGQIDQILAAATNPKDGALAAFAAVMGPVPGHEDQAPVVPLKDEWVLGDRVIKLVLEHLSELTVDELEAVRDTVEGREVSGGSHGRSAQAPRIPAVDVDRLQSWADEYATVLGAAFGHRLSSGVTVRAVRAEIGDAWAATTPTRNLLNRDADDETVLGPTCLIQIGPRLADADDSVLRSSMAHEVFHCIQDEVFGDSRLTPEWFHEGVAAWVGLAYGADVPFFANWWRTYLRSADWSLDSASYDALGMFATLQRAGLDVAAFVTAAFAGADPSAQALLAKLDAMVTDPAVAQLGPSPSRRVEWGPRWDVSGVGLGGTDARREPTPVVVGRASTITPATNGNSVQRVSFEQQGAVVITVEGTAYGAWRWGDASEDLSGPVNSRYCGNEPCLCPDGTPVPGGPYARIPGGEMTVGLASLGTRVSSLEFTVTPIQELCDPPDPAAPEGMYARLDGPGGGTWTPADGDAYCTADRTGGTWILSIGPATGRSISIAIADPPTQSGPQAAVNVFWSDGSVPFVNAPGLVLNFNDDLKSGTFSGAALDPTQANAANSAISGSFDCGDGGTPPLGSTPWTGR